MELGRLGRLNGRRNAGLVQQREVRSNGFDINKDIVGKRGRLMEQRKPDRAGTNLTLAIQGIGWKEVFSVTTHVSFYLSYTSAVLRRYLDKASKNSLSLGTR